MSVAKWSSLSDVLVVVGWVSCSIVRFLAVGTLVYKGRFYGVVVFAGMATALAPSLCAAAMRLRACM